MIWLTYEYEHERLAVEALAVKLGAQLGTGRFIMVTRVRVGQAMGAGPADLRAAANRIEDEAPAFAARMRHEADQQEAAARGASGTASVNSGLGGGGSGHVASGQAHGGTVHDGSGGAGGGGSGGTR